MKLSNCIRMAADLGLRRGKVLLMVSMLSFVLFFLLDMSLFLNTRNDYYETKIKSLTRDKDVYCLLYKGNAENYSDMYSFWLLGDDLNNLKGIEGSGSWSCIGGEHDLFQISSHIQGLCSLKTIDGDTVDLKKENDGIPAAYVGYSMKEQYPEGSTITVTLPEGEFSWYVAGTLEQGAEWMPRQVTSGEEYSYVLDDSVVINSIDMAGGFEIWFYTDGSSFSEIRKAVEDELGERGISAKLYSVSEVCDTYINSSSESTIGMYLYLVSYLTVFVILIGTSVMTVIVLENQKNYACLLTCGVTHGDIYKMIAISNAQFIMIPAFLAFIVRHIVVMSTDYEAVYGAVGRKLFLEMHRINGITKLLPVVVLVYLLASILPQIIFSRMNVREMMGDKA